MSLLIAILWVLAFPFLPFRQFINRPHYFSPPLPAWPLKGEAIPGLKAGAYLAIDYDSGQWLLAKNPHQHLLPASLTKMVTALVSLQYFNLDEWLPVYREYHVGQIAHLQAKSFFRVRDLLAVMLVHSANDAAWVLADNYQRRYRQNFVVAMNRWLRQHQLKETHLVNFDGEEDVDHYSSAADLTKISGYFLQNPFLAQLVRRKTVTIVAADGHRYSFASTDKLLGVANFRGIKTGWTPQAGECFAGFYQAHGKRIISVILQSQERFVDTQRLIKAIVTRLN